MATPSLTFNQPNRQANFWADTGKSMAAPTGQTLGSPSGTSYTPGAGFTFAPTTPTVAPGAGYSLLQQTKNPVLGLGQLSYLNKLGETSAANTKDLTDFTSRLKTFQPGQLGAVNQELSNITDVFSGKVGNDLAGIRDRYAQGARLATDNAIAAGNAARKSQAIGSGIGGSSYFGRQAAALQNEAGAKLAADLADRERADFGYVRGLQGSLLGRRDALANSYSGNALLPVQARGQILGSELGSLGQLGAMDLQNNIYGVTDNQSNQPFFPGSAPVSGYLPGGQIGGSVNGGNFFTQPNVSRSYRPQLPNYPANPPAGFRQRQYQQPGSSWDNPNAVLNGDGTFTGSSPNGGFRDFELGRLRSWYGGGLPYGPPNAPPGYVAPNVPAPYTNPYEGSEEQFYNNLDQSAYDATSYE